MSYSKTPQLLVKLLQGSEADRQLAFTRGMCHVFALSAPTDRFLGLYTDQGHGLRLTHCFARFENQLVDATGRYTVPQIGAQVDKLVSRAGLDPNQHVLWELKAHSREELQNLTREEGWNNDVAVVALARQVAEEFWGSCPLSPTPRDPKPVSPNLGGAAMPL